MPKVNDKTCAACDCRLEAGSTIAVTIGGKTVEVCCDECADKLREAHRSAATRKATVARG
jgi:RNase P subunit RPR2